MHHSSMPLCEEAWLLYPNSGYDEKFSISVFVHFNLFLSPLLFGLLRDENIVRGTTLSAIHTYEKTFSSVYVWPSRVAMSQVTKLPLTFDTIIKTTNFV